VLACVRARMCANSGRKYAANMCANMRECCTAIKANGRLWQIVCAGTLDHHAPKWGMWAPQNGASAPRWCRLGTRQRIDAPKVCTLHCFRASTARFWCIAHRFGAILRSVGKLAHRFSARCPKTEQAMLDLCASAPIWRKRCAPKLGVGILAQSGVKDLAHAV